MLAGLKVQEDTVYHTLALGNPVQKEGFPHTPHTHTQTVERLMQGQ